MITRTKSEYLVNMKLHYPTVAAKIDIDTDLQSFGGKRSFHAAFDAASMPQTPVLYNAGVIEAHTKLVAREGTEGSIGELVCGACVHFCGPPLRTHAEVRISLGHRGKCCSWSKSRLL